MLLLWYRGGFLINRSLTDVVSQILWCFYRVWRADISVLSQVRILYVNEKEKRYKWNMMFLLAGHSAGLLNNNHVQLRLPWLLESQLHGSQRKSYLSVPFFFHLRYEWLVRGRLYMPNLRYEPHHRICNLRYGTLVMGWFQTAFSISKVFTSSNGSYLFLLFVKPSSLHITCYPSYLILSTSVSFFRLLLKTQESTICNRPTKRIIIRIGTIGTW